MACNNRSWRDSIQGSPRRRHSSPVRLRRLHHRHVWRAVPHPQRTGSRSRQPTPLRKKSVECTGARKTIEKPRKAGMDSSNETRHQTTAEPWHRISAAGTYIEKSLYSPAAFVKPMPIRPPRIGSHAERKGLPLTGSSNPLSAPVFLDFQHAFQQPYNGSIAPLVRGASHFFLKKSQKK